MDRTVEEGWTSCEVESTPGIFVSKTSFADVVRNFPAQDCFLLAEEGAPVADVDLGERPVFFLGDNQDIPSEERAFLLDYGARLLSLGGRSYTSSHCIAVLNYLMDRRQAFGGENERT